MKRELWPGRFRNQGIALIVVLSCLLLVCGLVLSFFLSISTETRASKLSDSSSRSRDLTDTAVNLVMAQIREATSQGGQTAWASQPGMIRNYGSATGAGSSAPLAYYKLYSADQMVVSPSASAGFNPLIDVPGSWHATPALYTDLNQPAKDLGGALQYPIVDPSAATAIAGIPAVKGFAIDVTNTPLAASEDFVNQLPMPVRWVYVLQDGKLTVPSGGTESTATWSEGAANAPTAGNPVVGRVAFWTDDETSKVNVNTAAGDEWVENQSGNDPVPGSYWDVPRINSNFDKERLARRQIGQHEFQRYPGHPATTYLSSVFPNLTRTGIGSIVSRIQEGGSLGGTVIATAKVQTDSDRLYASVDELIFSQDRTIQSINGVSRQELERGRFFITANSRAPEVNLFNRPRISIWPLHVNDSSAYRTAFDRLINFCSHINNSGYSFQRQNAYSPTADYQSIQRNQQLYEYLQEMTSLPVPGFGGSFLTKYTIDRDQILTQIFDYIRSTNLFDDTLEPQDQNNPASWTFPTRGNQFTSSRTRTNDANKRMGGQPGHGQVTPIYIASNDTMGFGRFNTISEVGLHFICNADGRGERDATGNPATSEDEAKIQSNDPATNRNLMGVQLEEDEIRVEVMFLMELFSVAQGWNAINQDFQIRVTGLDGLVLRGENDSDFYPLNFPANGTIHINRQPFAHTRTIGGANGFRVTLADRGIPTRGTGSNVLAADGGTRTLANTYPFVSLPITIKPGPNGADGRMYLDYVGEEPIKIEIYSEKYSTIPAHTPDYIPDANFLVQTIEVDFTQEGSTGVVFPSPELVLGGHTETQSGNVEFVSTKENFWTLGRTSGPGGKAGRITYITRPPFRTDRQNIGGLFRDRDVLRTLVPEHGDYRLIAARKYVPKTTFVPHQYYNTLSQRVAHSFTEGYQGHNLLYNSTREGKLAPLSSSQNYHVAYSPDVPYKNPPWGSDSRDWDHGTGITPDGAYINKPDEGHNAAGTVPYFANDWDHEATGPTFFSPNRQATSAAMFGSLPTQVKSGKDAGDRAWRTLLFKPSPFNGHIGSLSPADHLLLDLFWMPVVEPYAISEPFSTAGKINMNYQMVPFTYVKRSTGLMALFQSERVTAIPLTAVGSYKSGTSSNYRYMIDAEKTLEQLDERFSNGDIYRSASEICDIFLIPKDVPGFANLTTNSMPAFWEAHALTGDNVRERPYATLYPRLTTKSNTYTIHYKVQVLQQASRSRGTSATAWATWDNSKDLVQSEIRGSTTIERYVDPSDPSLPDFAELPAESSETLDSHYRFRVLNTRRFAP